MATALTKWVTREVDSYMERGRPIVVRMTDEGIYIKRKGEHWKTAVLCPWKAAFQSACIIQARKDREERKAKRAARKAGLR